MHIRQFRTGDERSLYAVFHSAVRGLASRNYTPEQVAAWAPANPDLALWSKRMHDIQPFVLEHEGAIVAFADIQDSGAIDLFFVSAAHARQGVGSALMRHLLAQARAREIAVLSSHVSLTAQPFFEKFGFTIVEQLWPVRRGVVLPNALMRKNMAADHLP